MQASELQNKFERIRANKWFEAFVISVIVISALLVGAKTYELPAGMSSVTLF
ncbi:MAG: ion transporter, partial [Pseudomonadota bacterium]|nr:ion transporter [Pseudomonadota bacterium]